MEQIRYKLVEVNSSPSLGSTNNPGTVTFYSRIKARRIEKSGKVNVLLQWIPENVLPDSWVPEESVIKCKRVPYSSLPLESLALLDPRLKEECDVPRVKRRRK
ncbi:Zinc finger protein AEBP2, partial [Stegodyphus mimosarum]